MSYDVSVVARFMQEPHELHWREVKRILHYVEGTRAFGNQYYVGAQLDMVGFTDSNLVGDNADIKKTSTK